MKYLLEASQSYTLISYWFPLIILSLRHVCYFDNKRSSWMTHEKEKKIKNHEKQQKKTTKK